MGYQTAAAEREAKAENKRKLINAAAWGGSALFLATAAPFAGAGIAAAALGASAALKGGSVLMKEPQLATGFFAMIMKSKFAKMLLEATGETPKAPSAPKAQNPNEDVAVVYPVDQRGHLGKPSVQSTKAWETLRDKLPKKMMATETRLSDNGSTTQRFSGGKPHSVGTVRGKDAVVPSRERRDGGTSYTDYHVNGKKVDELIINEVRPQRGGAPLFEVSFVNYESGGKPQPLRTLDEYQKTKLDESMAKTNATVRHLENGQPVASYFHGKKEQEVYSSGEPVKPGTPMPRM